MAWKNDWKKLNADKITQSATNPDPLSPGDTSTRDEAQRHLKRILDEGGWPDGKKPDEAGDYGIFKNLSGYDKLKH